MATSECCSGGTGGQLRMRIEQRTHRIFVAEEHEGRVRTPLECHVRRRRRRPAARNRRPLHRVRCEPACSSSFNSTAPRTREACRASASRHRPTPAWPRRSGRRTISAQRRLTSRLQRDSATYCGSDAFQRRGGNAAFERFKLGERTFRLRLSIAPALGLPRTRRRVYADKDRVRAPETRRRSRRDRPARQ